MKRALQITIALCLLSILGLQIYHGFQLKQNGLTQVCPVDAITMVNGKAVIDAKKCIGCRRCVDGIVASQSSVLQPSTPETVTILPDSALTSGSVAKKATLLTQTQAAKTDKGKAPISAPIKKTHHVDPTVCIGCGLCVPHCPSNAITMVDGKAFIDKDKCTNSDICVVGNKDDYDGCPVNAISAP